MLSPEEWGVVGLTLRVSAYAVGGALLPGLALALLLARRRFPGRFLVDAIIYLPLAVPPVVTGWLLLVLLGIHGLIGSHLHRWFGWQLAFSTAGAAVACATMILPLIVRSTLVSLEAIDPRLMKVASSLGAGPVDRILTIALPLAAPGILVGLVAAYAASLGEFGAVITFAANIPGVTRTLPLAIYTALQQPDGDAAAVRLSLVSIALALSGLAVADVADRRLRRRVR